jgi:hypothetical protein
LKVWERAEAKLLDIVSKRGGVYLSLWSSARRERPYFAGLRKRLSPESRMNIAFSHACSGNAAVFRHTTRLFAAGWTFVCKNDPADFTWRALPLIAVLV